MDYNNETKRLEGHEPMKEIPESFEEYKPVAATGRRTRRRGRSEERRVGKECEPRGWARGGGGG